MMGRKGYEEKLFYGFSLTQKVPEGHLVRQLDRVIDLSFVRPLVGKYYSHTGQPSVDPVVLFKTMLLGYLYGITSERRLAEECGLNMAFMWYLGYDLDEPTPNHSVISKARSRYGKEVFEKFFQEVLSICVKAGLVKGEKVFADSTLISANASLKSILARAEAREVRYTPREYVEKLFEENPVEEGAKDKSKAEPGSSGPEEVGRQSESKKVSSKTHYSSTDPEASLVTRPWKGLMIAYKGHFTVDSGRVITALKVTPAGVDDAKVVEALVEAQPIRPREFCADSHYGVAEVYEGLLKKGIKPVIPRRSPQSRIPSPGKLSLKAFRYIPERDVFMCPEGKELRRKAYLKRWGSYYYRARKKECSGCRRRQACSTEKSPRMLMRYPREKQEAVDWAVNHLATPEAKKTLKERAIFAEWIIAEAKTLHGLRKALFRGLEKTSIQALLTASVQNIKRLIKHCRDRITQTAVNPFITEGLKRVQKSFDQFLTMAVQLKYTLILKTQVS